MRHALARGALHLRLRSPQCLSGCLFITAGDSNLDLLDEGPHARLSRLIAFGPRLGLSDALARGCRISHVPVSPAQTEKPRSRGGPGGAAFYAWAACKSRNHPAAPSHHTSRQTTITAQAVLGAPAFANTDRRAKSDGTTVNLERLSLLRDKLALRRLRSSCSSRSFALLDCSRIRVCT